MLPTVVKSTECACAVSRLYSAWRGTDTPHPLPLRAAAVQMARLQNLKNVCAHMYSSVPCPCMYFPPPVLPPAQGGDGTSHTAPSLTPGHRSEVLSLSLSHPHILSPWAAYPRIFPKLTFSLIFPYSSHLLPSAKVSAASFPGLLSPSTHSLHSGNQSDPSQSPI